MKCLFDIFVDNKISLMIWALNSYEESIRKRAKEIEKMNEEIKDIEYYRNKGLVEMGKEIQVLKVKKDQWKKQLREK